MKKRIYTYTSTCTYVPDFFGQPLGSMEETAKLLSQEMVEKIAERLKGRADYIEKRGFVPLAVVEYGKERAVLISAYQRSNPSVGVTVVLAEQRAGEEVRKVLQEHGIGYNSLLSYDEVFEVVRDVWKMVKNKKWKKYMVEITKALQNAYQTYQGLPSPTLPVLHHSSYR